MQGLNLKFNSEDPWRAKKIQPTFCLFAYCISFLYWSDRGGKDESASTGKYLTVLSQLIHCMKPLGLISRHKCQYRE